MRNDHSVYGKASEQVKMAVLLSLFQPGVITRLKSADVRVDDPDYIDGSVITADFLLHIDFDKLLRYAKKLMTDYIQFFRLYRYCGRYAVRMSCI